MSSDLKILNCMISGIQEVRDGELAVETESQMKQNLVDWRSSGVE